MRFTSKIDLCEHGRFSLSRSHMCVDMTTGHNTCLSRKMIAIIILAICQCVYVHVCMCACACINNNRLYSTNIQGITEGRIISL